MTGSIDLRRSKAKTQRIRVGTVVAVASGVAIGPHCGEPAPVKFTPDSRLIGLTCQVRQSPMKRAFIASVGIFLFALVLLSVAEAIAGGRIYTTNFPLTENPISEDGNWINGGATGLDWFNIRTDGTHAHGVTTTGSYTDPTAILRGTWGADQTVEAIVYSVNQNERYYQEVEIRLRSSISAHSSKGYEILFRCLKTSSAYMQIVRWNGPLGDFTYLAKYSGAAYGVANGDKVKATIAGNKINVYINDVLKGTATDGTYTSGNPGMGFNYGCGSTYSDFGFASFTASDGDLSPPPASPEDLRVVAP